MSTSQAEFGPNAHQRANWRSTYYANDAEVQSVRASRRREAPGVAAGVLYGSPIVFGTTDEFYDFNLDYYKVVREGKFNIKDTFPSTLVDYIDPWSDNLSPYTYNQRGGDTELRQREYQVKSRTFAAQAADLSIESGRRTVNLPKRSDSALLGHQILDYAVRTIQGNGNNQGLFAPIITGAQHGFLISSAFDNDVQFKGDPNLVEDTTLLSTYWPADRLGNNHPLRDLYNKFYNYQGVAGLLWRSDTDRSGSILNPGISLAINNPLNNKPSTLNYGTMNDPVVAIMGPISQTELNFGNGNNIIAASPVMLAGLHRTIRTREGKGHNPQYDDFHADTVLYPSPVGQFASNSLNVGNGNNIIYYDSSFKNIIAGTGNNIFIPSFGSFNWSISWIPAYGTQLPQILSEPVLPSPPSIKQGWPGTNDLNQDWLLNSESGLPLISPIPWDQQDGDILNPNRASKIPGKKTIKGSYTDDNSKFAADPQWGKTANLYTINTYLRDPLQKTYFNWQQLNDKDESTVKKSYNPVNKLGNVVLKANGGNNIFYGMDWSFWQHLLPNVGLTTANQPADNAKRVTRAAQHAWYQMTMIGGRGSNTFNLGNVIDNITNNGLFYDGTSSYKISLTHDRIYDSSDEINNQGIAFGNNIDPVTGEPLVSVVNLQLKADPGTVSVTIQNADPGQISSTSEVSAWNSGINAVNKLAGNTLKIQEDFKKAVKAPSWISNSKTLAFIAGRAVPFADTAIAITSAVLGIMSAIAAKPAKPPKQKIEATYAVQGLDTSQKAVLINDWHPGTKINLNLPQVDANEWGNITLSINPPSATSATDNTSHGVYLNVKTTDSLTRIKDDFPLVVLENVGKTEPFGYWSYSFVDPDGMGPLQAGYNQLGPNNLKLFGILPDPSKLLSDDGTTPLNPTTFPVNYQYKSDNGFDMEYDAQNYASRKQTTGTPYYSRYYFDQNISPSNVPAPNWSTKSNLWQYTSNVSFEFDSRSLGWYWQPVMKLDPNNIQNTINPESQTIDFDQSKLWIRNRKDGSWTSSSYADIMYLTRAFIDSQKATTFYYSSKNDEGAKEISRRQAKIDQLEQLATVLPDLRSLDQSLITDERNRLYTLSQVETVKPVQSFQAEGSQRSGLMVRFTSVDTLDKAMPVDLMLYDNDGRIKATVVDGGPPNNSGLPWLGSDPLSGANPSSLLI